MLDENRLAERTVALSEPALLDTQRAFDGVASDYDRSNTENPILCAMRRRLLGEIEHRVRTGSRILDLGCGPGADAEQLALEGFRVTGIDWSPAMVEEARGRIARAGLSHRVSIQHLGIQQLDQLPPATFDAAYSNFGALNCVPDLGDAARQLASRLTSSGLVIASVIGRVCPWEIALFGLRGNWSRARVRFAREPVAVPLNGRTVWTQYYSPAEFEQTFRSAGFSRVSLTTLGLFAPPPYMHRFGERHPRLIRTLRQLDDAIGGWPGFRTCGDHFLIVLRKA